MHKPDCVLKMSSSFTMLAVSQKNECNICITITYSNALILKCDTGIVKMYPKYIFIIFASNQVDFIRFKNFF